MRNRYELKNLCLCYFSEVINFSVVGEVLSQRTLLQLTYQGMSASMQVRELFAANDCLSSENLHLRGSLGEAVATTANLAKKLEEKEIALHAILEQEAKESETVAEVESVVLTNQQEAGGRTQEEFGCAQATQTVTFWDSRSQEGVASKSVDDMKDEWGASKLVSITDISELKIEADDSLPHTNSRNSQENDTVEFMENEGIYMNSVFLSSLMVCVFTQLKWTLLFYCIKSKPMAT